MYLDAAADPHFLLLAERHLQFGLTVLRSNSIASPFHRGPPFRGRHCSVQIRSGQGALQILRHSERLQVAVPGLNSHSAAPLPEIQASRGAWLRRASRAAAAVVEEQLPEPGPLALGPYVVLLQPTMLAAAAAAASQGRAAAAAPKYRHSVPYAQESRRALVRPLDRSQGSPFGRAAAPS